MLAKIESDCLSLRTLRMVSACIYVGTTEYTHSLSDIRTNMFHSQRVSTRSFSSTSHVVTCAQTFAYFTEREASVVTLVSVASIKQHTYSSNVRQIPICRYIFVNFDCYIIMKEKKIILTDCCVCSPSI